MAKAKSDALVIFDGKGLKLNEDMMAARNEAAQEVIETAKKSMNDALLKEADNLRDDMSKMFTRGFQRSWKIGEHLKKIATDIDKYEAGAIQKLAAYLHYSPEMLHKWIRFFEDYTEAEVKKLSELRTQLAQSPLSWGHVDVAYLVEDKKERIQFLEMAAENDLTVDEMMTCVKEWVGDKGGSTDRHGGGRPIKVPATYSARLENLDKFCGQVLRNSKEMWQHSKYGFLQTIDEVPSDKLGKMIKSMDKEIEKVEKAAEKLKEVHKELQKARASAQDRLEAPEGKSDPKPAAGGKGRKGSLASAVANAGDD